RAGGHRGSVSAIRHGHLPERDLAVVLVGRRALDCRHRGVRAEAELHRGGIAMKFRVALLTLIVGVWPLAAADELDLTSAIVVTPPDFAGPQARAVKMLMEEVEARSLVRWDRAGRLIDSKSAIVVSADGKGEPEGYTIETANQVVSVKGNDARGV